MAIRRVAVRTVADPVHQEMRLEGDANDTLPTNRVYVDRTTGRTFDGRRGDKLRDVTPDATEIPRTTWYERPHEH